MGRETQGFVASDRGSYLPAQLENKRSARRHRESQSEQGHFDWQRRE